MDVINERSGVEFTAHFEDAAGNPTVPPSVHWRLDCESTGKVLQSDTAIDPVTVTDESGIVDCYVTVNIPGSLNTIQGGDWRELKTLLVIAAKDTDGEYSQEYQYYVRNIRGR